MPEDQCFVRVDRIVRDFIEKYIGVSVNQFIKLKIVEDPVIGPMFMRFKEAHGGLEGSPHAEPPRVIVVPRPASPKCASANIGIAPDVIDGKIVARMKCFDCGYEWVEERDWKIQARKVSIV